MEKKQPERPFSYSHQQLSDGESVSASSGVGFVHRAISGEGDPKTRPSGRYKPPWG